MAITNPGIEDGFDLNSNNLLALGTLVDDGYATNEIPKSGNINTVFKDLYRYMQHLKDTGISQWDNATSYEKFSRIMRNGIIYQSLSDANQGNDPLSTLDTFWGYTVSQISGYKNILINGDKRVNQRAYADGVLADGVYGYDRWKGADTDVNIEQIIEQQNIVTGTYTISWAGGGTATVNGVSGLSSGDSVSITVSGNISVKVPKASTNIQLERGSIKTDYEVRNVGLELSMCQRFYQISNQAINGYASVNGEIWGGRPSFVNSMRAVPSVATSSFSETNCVLSAPVGATLNQWTFLTTASAIGAFSAILSVTADAEL